MNTPDVKTERNGKVTYYSGLKEKIRSKISYLLDITANTMYHPKGFTRPIVYKGYFNKKTAYSQTQSRLFSELLENGFKRELFQIVFPKQVAGLVKKLKEEDGFDEAHIRFYRDGSIDIELEQGRFDESHWRGERISGHEYLIGLLGQLNLDSGDKHYIENHLLKDKEMHKLCEVSWDNDYFVGRIIFTILFLWEYVVGTGLLIGLLYLLAKDS